MPKSSSPARASLTPFCTSHPRFDAIFCDVDGCLVDEGGGTFDLDALAQITHHNAQAIERRDRPVLTLCTGRPQPFAECLARVVGNTLLPLVAENGAWVYHPLTNLYELDPAITREQRAMVRDAASWLDERYAPLGVRQQPGKTASVSLYHPDPATLHTMMPEIREGFASKGWALRVSMTVTYINCDLAHVSKGTGLARLIAHARLDPARLAGIGDTASDLAIREKVAFFACPSNAVAELKARADFVAKSAEVQGVLEILSKIGQRESR